MAQINLLKQPSVSHTQSAAKIFEWVFVAILLGLIAYYAWLFYQSKKIDTNIILTQQSITQQTQQALSVPQRPELITRQEQLKNYSNLISQHAYWSQILPVIASSTLNTITYSDLNIAQDGTLALSASAPTIEDLDLYLQVFDLPSVYKYFSNVKVSSFSKVQNTSGSSVKFQVTMNYDPSLTKFVPLTSASANK